MAAGSIGPLYPMFTKEDFDLEDFDLDDMEVERSRASSSINGPRPDPGDEVGGTPILKLARQSCDLRHGYYSTHPEHTVGTARDIRETGTL